MVTPHACNIESEMENQISIVFGINLHVNIKEAQFVRIVFMCTSRTLLHNNNNNNRKRTSFALKTAFRSVEATYLYSPDTLWMLTWGKCVEQSLKKNKKKTKTIGWIGTSIDQESWLMFCLLVVGLWPKCVHLFTQRCTLYFSWGKKKKEGEIWLNHICMHTDFLYDFLLLNQW